MMKALSPGGPGARLDAATPSLGPAAPVALEYSTTRASSKADLEWRRFLDCAIPTPNGLGLYDPSESPDMPTGVPGEDWDEFIRDCGRLGKRGKT